MAWQYVPIHLVAVGPSFSLSVTSHTKQATPQSHQKRVLSVCLLCHGSRADTFFSSQSVCFHCLHCVVCLVCRSSSSLAEALAMLISFPFFFFLALFYKMLLYDFQVKDQHSNYGSCANAKASSGSIEVHTCKSKSTPSCII